MKAKFCTMLTAFVVAFVAFVSIGCASVDVASADSVGPTVNYPSSKTDLCFQTVTATKAVKVNYPSSKTSIFVDAADVALLSQKTNFTLNMPGQWQTGSTISRSEIPRSKIAYEFEAFRTRWRPPARFSGVGANHFARADI